MAKTIEQENQIAKESVKFDGEKIPFDLVPYDALWEIARVLRYGKNKYEARNWENTDREPFRRGRLFAALERHLMAYWMGEDTDPESGYSHLAHAGCMLLMLLAYVKRDIGEDDRFKINTEGLDSYMSQTEREIVEGKVLK